MPDAPAASAIVSGGASGLGAAVAAKLRERGLVVVTIDATDSPDTSIHGDVRDPEVVERAVHLATSAAELRVAVACAGTGYSARIVGRQGVHDLASFERVVSVNLVGTFNVLRLTALAMSSNTPSPDGERGVIVNTASVAAFEPQIGQSAYGASKAGVVALTNVAAHDLASRGIRVVAIAPGVFDTPMIRRHNDAFRAALTSRIPFPARAGKPSEFALLVGQIIDNPIINGTTLRLDGALRMPPR